MGPIVVYADAGDDQEGRATTGTITFSGTSPLGWASRKQDIVTLSMTEAEYVSAAAGAQEEIWAGRLVIEVIGPSAPPELRIDSEGARKLANNPVYHRRTKHIDRRHHFIRERVTNGDIELSWVPGRDNWADIFTKRLGRAELTAQRKRIGMMSLREWLSDQGGV